MHRLFTELIPGGAPVKKSTAQYQALLATMRLRGSRLARPRPRALT
jgi:hypothetical protein